MKSIEEELARNAMVNRGMGVMRKALRVGVTSLRDGCTTFLTSLEEGDPHSIEIGPLMSLILQAKTLHMFLSEGPACLILPIASGFEVRGMAVFTEAEEGAERAFKELVSGIVKEFGIEIFHTTTTSSTVFEALKIFVSGYSIQLSRAIVGDDERKAKWIDETLMAIAPMAYAGVKAKEGG